uniref:Uncharacterized protein n=1 Tax=Anguilla anguilla TaxID=7936 RepID=A0A0E9S861_ANGAN
MFFICCSLNLCNACNIGDCD